MDSNDLIKIATDPHGLTNVGLLLVFIWMLYRETIYWGKQVREIKAEREEWKTMALGNLRLAADAKMAVKAKEQQVIPS